MRHLIAAATVFAFAGAAHAQSDAAKDPETAVWEVVEASWKDEVAESGKWPGEYVHDEVVAWGPDWPMPRGKASIEKWMRYDDGAGTIIEYEITPVDIQIVGATAVAHYAAVTVREDDKKQREREMIGLSETLVKTDAGWKFLALTSFSMKRGE